MESHNLPSINCCISSLFFLTNVFVTYYYEYYMYSALFLGLTISSSTHHLLKTPITCIVDKFFVFAVVGYGGYIFCNKIINGSKQMSCAIVIAAFLGTVFLYYYGSANGQFCFAEDKEESDKWHQLLHLLSSIGHHFIVLM